MDPITCANFTPLTDTVAIGDDATVLFLLETGADPEQCDAKGRSALTLAVLNGQVKSVTYLLEYGADPKRIDGTGKSPLQHAEGIELSASLDLLSGAVAEVHKPSETTARRMPPPVRRKGRWSIVRTLMLWMVGAGVAVGAFEMRSSFNAGASETIFNSISTNNIGQISKLLISGISPNIRDAYGNSALLVAANNGRMDIVRLLLRNKADPNLGTPQGISALKRGGMEHADIIELLLDYGADPNRVDPHGKSLLAYACTSWRYSKLISLLLKHKADPNAIGEIGPPLVSLIESCDEGQLASMKALLAAGANPNGADSAATPILVWSAERSSASVVKLLLSAGAKTSVADSTRRSALDAACSKERPEIVQLLLDHGADPNSKDKDGNNSVMYAVSGMVDAPESTVHDCEAILRLLQQHGAKLDAANSSGRTPSQFAAKLGFSQFGWFL